MQILLVRISFVSLSCMSHQNGMEGCSSASLWASWFRLRYLKKGFSKSILSNTLGSCIWKKIKGMAGFLLHGIKWHIGDGRSVNLWFGRWLLDRPIANLLPAQVLDSNALVSSTIHGNAWELSNLNHAEGRDLIAQKIQHLSPPCSSKADFASWKFNPSGSCSLRSALDLVSTRGDRCPWAMVFWNRIRQPSTSFFLWRLCHKRTPTSKWVQRIHIPLASACPFCLRDEESTLHLLFQCTISALAWD